MPMKKPDARRCVIVLHFFLIIVIINSSQIFLSVYNKKSMRRSYSWRFHTKIAYLQPLTNWHKRYFCLCNVFFLFVVHHVHSVVFIQTICIIYDFHVCCLHENLNKYLHIHVIIIIIYIQFSWLEISGEFINLLVTFTSI